MHLEPSSGLIWRRRRQLTSVAATVGIAWALVFAGEASASWIEPVPGPVNQTNASAFGINGDGSTPFVGLFQSHPAPASTSNQTIQVSSAEQMSWNVSAPLNSTGQIGGASITASRLPYVAWVEYRSGPTHTAEVHVVRYAGTSWTPVGGSLNHDETVNAYSLSIANFGSVPWVAWQEGGDKLWVARFDGNGWVYVGGPISDCTNCSTDGFPSLTSVNGVPWLAYRTPSGVQVATVVNGRWSNVPGPFNSSGGLPNIGSVGGIPFVAWSQGGANLHSQLLRISSFSGNGAWVTPPALNIDKNEAARDVRIASVGGIPWVVWDESSRPYADARELTHVYVKEFDGATWGQVGGVLNIDPNQTAYAGGITDVAGSADVAITQSQTDGGSAVRVLRYQGFRPFVAPVSSTPTPTQSTPTGTEIKFRFVLRKPATVRLDFTQPVKGRRDRGVCAAATRRNRHMPTCTRYISRGRFSFHAHTGTNTLVFHGRLPSGKQLKPGTYRVVITAIGAGGVRSTSQSLRVRI
jgi:hypothetical protein